LDIEEESTKFSFGGTGSHLAHDLAEYMGRAIIQQYQISGSRGSMWVGTEEVVTSGM